MKIIDDMICFNSSDRFWGKESEGIKSNTVRVFDKSESELVNAALNGKGIKKIRIENHQTEEFFIRDISDITQYFAYDTQVRLFYKDTDCQDLYDGSVWIFSWKHT